MRGVLSTGAHLPYRRLDRTTIAAVAGAGGGKGTRTVASYDEDSTTMGVEAARVALRSTETQPHSLWFATATPAYLDKTNATAIQAALRLDRTVAAYDALGSVRSGMGAFRAALAQSGPALVVTADVRTGRPGGPEESAGGDGAAAVLLGDDTDGPLLAEVVATAAVTEEFVDRWRTPGDPASKVWEERFGETRYLPLALEAWKLALGEAGLDADKVDHLIVAGTHDRAVTAVTKKLGVAAEKVADRLTATVGNVGTAQPLLLLGAVLESLAGNPRADGKTIVVVTLADGADVLVLRTTAGLTSYQPRRPIAAQVTAGGRITYGKFLAWRGFLPVEPPRRPEPARVSASAAGRSREWKFGMVSPQGVLADAAGTVATFTIDKLAYSPSPPVVFAVVDFDPVDVVGGGRLPVELTDVDAEDVKIGDRVEMTFRRLFTADGIHNYFWKARPLR